MVNRERQTRAIDALEDEEVKASLNRLLYELPAIEKQLHHVQEGIDFVSSVLKDEKAVDLFEERASAYKVSPESLEAAARLADRLPELEALLHQAEDFADFVINITKDERTVNDLEARARKYTDPLIRQAEETKMFIEEVKKEAENDTTEYRLRDVFKWRKRRPVQKVLRFTHAVITVSERKQNN
jgi:5-bromo-4-chloroindolyl phosphate hydrolysis protein